MEQDGVVLQGRRLRKRYSVSFSVICFAMAYCFLLISANYIRGRDDFFFGHFPANPLVSSICGSIAAIVTTVGVALALGFRAKVGISDRGIFIRDERGEFVIRWSDVIKISTRSSWGSVYLIAELPPKSSLLFSGPWALDRKQANVIRICD